MKRQKKLKLRRVIAHFADGSTIVFAINQRRWQLNVERDIVSTDGPSGFVDHVALPSGKVALQADFDKSVWQAGAQTVKAKRAARGA